MLLSSTYNLRKVDFYVHLSLLMLADATTPTRLCLPVRLPAAVQRALPSDMEAGFQAAHRFHDIAVRPGESGRLYGWTSSKSPIGRPRVLSKREAWELVLGTVGG